MKHDWYWAAHRNEPAGDRFVIANGKDELWPRVRAEISADEKCAWNAIHRGKHAPDLADMLYLLLNVVSAYSVNQNRFVLEASKIPVFASFLRDAPLNLGNYVSNPIYPEAPVKVEPYSPEMVKRLGERASNTLGIEPDWFEY